MGVLARFGRFWRRVAVPLSVAVLSIPAGCAYRGGDIGNPVARKLEWRSYIGGDDIRATCAAGTPDRYRLVYNGVYERQLRMYDLDSARHLLIARVRGPADVDQVSLGDLLKPWRAKAARVQLDPAQYRTLVAAFTTSGMFGPPPVGLDLPSRSFFWTAAYCRHGHFGFTAWKYPSAAFTALTFVKPLLALDPTGVPLARAHVLRYDSQWEMEAAKGNVVSFLLTVGQHGLVQ